MNVIIDYKLVKHKLLMTCDERLESSVRMVLGETNVRHRWPKQSTFGN